MTLTASLSLSFLKCGHYLNFVFLMTEILNILTVLLNINKPESGQMFLISQSSLKV